MGHVDIPAAPLFRGFLAGFGGGIPFGLALLFRPAYLLPAATMLFAPINHLARGNGFIPVSQLVEAGLVFVAFPFIGPGRRSLNGRLLRKNSTF